MCNCKKEPIVVTPLPPEPTYTYLELPDVPKLTQEEIDWFNNIDEINPPTE
jgi:hypothetical protein